jgi:methanogenic corrinoid protein MtbC1
VTGLITPEDHTDFGHLLVGAHETAAITFALALLDRGVEPQDVLLGLIAPSQLAIGDRWARAQWSIAQEHAATHVSEQVVAAVSSWATANTVRRPDRGTAVVACVDGEWHALPAKLFAEVIRLHGWDVHFLGASVPGPHLISYLHEYGPDVFAVSCSLPTRLIAAHRVITAAQEAGVPVLAGGAGFGPGARWALRPGADRVAVSAADAVRELLHWPPTLKVTIGTPVAAAVGNDDHIRLAQRRDALVSGAVDNLERQHPSVRGYSPAQREATRADLEHIVDFLASALFVDDPELFTNFVGWLCEVLDSRRVPLATVDTVLRSYLADLGDIPRATRHLTAGRTRLRTAGADALR